MTDTSPENVARMLEGVTPGPWKCCETSIHGRKYGGCWVEGPYVEDDDGVLRSLLIPMTGSGGARSYTTRLLDIQEHDHNDANARFIAWAREAVPTLTARLAEAEASVRWVDEVYPSRVEAGGAGVEITWAEFNAMQRVAGVREDKRIGDQEGKASHNHRLRVARNEALARAEAAEAKLAEVQALVAAAVMEAAEPETLRCGLRSGTISDALAASLWENIRALIRPDAMSALEAYRDREVAKALKTAEERLRVLARGGQDADGLQWFPSGEMCADAIRAMITEVKP